MSDYLKKQKFKNIDLADPFFNSLKNDYKEFEEWFERKSDAEAYVFYEDGLLDGFLYFKCEYGDVTDITPALNCLSALKIGTFKINPHGTRLGQRFIKKALDYAVMNKMQYCYVTIFQKEETNKLIEMLKTYGFFEYGNKATPNGTELVLVKSLVEDQGSILENYPLIKTEQVSKHLLSIYPEYHTQMFPDSILNNESVNILEDVSFTNSIHKIYVTVIQAFRLKPGDILVMYRTRTDGKSAEYTSVATSICVVEEVKHQRDFKDFEHFYKYSSSYSVFDKNDLRSWYNKGKCYTIKMTYNAAFSKRLIRKKLIEQIGLERAARWTFLPLSDEQFFHILKEGGVSESIIIN